MGEFSKTDLSSAVVFIPGFLGTEIYEEGILTKKLWPVIDPLLHRRMALNINGEPNTDSKGNYLTYPGEVFETYWPFLGGHNQTKIFLDALRNAGINVVKVPYDWRLDLSHKNTMKAVEEGINYALTYTKGKPVTIVAHSAGGLVARYYLLKNPDAPVENFINIGSPNLGTPRAMKSLIMGDNLGVPILVNAICKKMVQNILSVYQLLPGERFVNVYNEIYKDFNYTTFYFDEYNNITDYNSTKKYIEDNYNLDLFKQGMLFRDEIENGKLNSSINEYRFVGYRRSNIVQIIRTQESKCRILFGTGDGVVPIKSADMNDNNAKVYYFDLSHMGLLSNSVVSRVEGKAVRKRNYTKIHELIINIIKGREIDNPEKFPPLNVNVHS
ncbi:MAG: hypothetical protein GX387_10395 [Clostridium sp.]|nr:hypothetical protein [Clostridium sp.]